MEEGDQEKQQQQQRSWLDLPEDVIDVIHSKLVVCHRDHDAFHSVCTLWRSHKFRCTSSYPLSHYFQVLKSSVLSCTSPYLLMSIRRNNTAVFFDPISNLTYHSSPQQHLLPSELSEAHIMYSNNGWLLMVMLDPNHNNHNVRNMEWTLFFFNPVTKAVITLPNIYYVHPTVACFSSPPTSPHCMVVAIDYNDDEVTLGSIKPGQTSWKHYKYKWLQDNVYASLSCPVILLKDKMLYMLGDRGQLVSIDLDDLTNYQIKQPLTSRRNMFRDQSFLVQADDIDGGDDLIGVSIDIEGLRCYVFKMDFEENTWEEVESLDNKMVFVNEWGSFSQAAPTKEAGNKIYFERFYGTNIVYYSLATRKFHTFFGEYVDYSLKKKIKLNDHKAYFSSTTIHNTTAWTHCAWVKPTITSSNSDIKRVGWSSI